MISKNDLDRILAQELKKFKDSGTAVNLAEIERRTGISRALLRRWKENGYAFVSNSRRGRPAGSLKLHNYEEEINSLLKAGVANSSVILERIREHGYDGGLTIVKEYIAKHRDLVPAPRHVEQVRGNRGRRYTTGPGDCYQMDWGFVKIMDLFGNEWRCACFAMVCHHCGFRYIEFFPNAKQENLFIGMTHAFSVMGIPSRVLTDNMKSVVIRRDAIGNIIFNHDYDEFQHLLGFRTELCKVAHPFTKGAVERLVRYVKDNFIQARQFINVNELNRAAFFWCMKKNDNMLKEKGCIPNEVHAEEKASLSQLADMDVLIPYLAPLRTISFDGFVEYEGRRYGVPYSYTAKKARVMRSGNRLMVLTTEGTILQEYDVDWARKSKTCPDQWGPSDEEERPEEHPTAPVKAVINVSTRPGRNRFSRFSIRRCEDE